MQRLISQTLSVEQFDLVYVHLFRMAPYAADLTSVYRLVDLTDVISQEIIRSLPYRSAIWRTIYRLERPRIERYERWVAKSFEETWLISEADRNVLAASCPEANIQVIRNGVDVDRFHPTGQPREPNRLIFVGHLRVFHNIDAVTYLVREILPVVRQRVPDCTVKIVGADPGPEVERLARYPGVTVTGFVPDLNDALNRAALFVAPLRFAAGVQNKVLEAMATATPVVTTRLVNAGLRAEPDRELCIADDAASIGDAIFALLRDPKERERIGQAGLRFVRGKYHWNHAVERLRLIESQLTGR